MPGGHYSLEEAVINPVHTERSGGCAGIGTPTPHKCLEGTTSEGCEQDTGLTKFEKYFSTNASICLHAYTNALHAIVSQDDKSV